MQERLVQAEPPAVTHRPPQDPPQHVPPALVGGHGSVGDEHRGRPDVVRDHAEGRVLRGHSAAVVLRRQLLDARQDPGEEVRVEVVVHSLEDRREALEPGARVHRGPRQRRHLSRGVALELHEDEVPDLERVVARAVDEVRGVAGKIRAPVVVQLRARAAGARLPHRPEVVLLAEAQDARGRQVALPELRRLVVLGVHGGPEPLGRDAVALVAVRDELPGEPDGVGLEVVAEREVAEHLEERLVAAGVAHVVEVVVLAAGAHALLGRRGPGVVALLAPREDVLELVHPGVGEEQRRVLGRDQRGRRDAAVLPLLEVAEESLPDFSRFHTSPG